MKEYLEVIIQGRANNIIEFSDKFMIENLLYARTPNTIRSITRKLYKNGIIEKTRMGARGEKFYKIKDYEKASILYQQNIGLYVHNRKHKPKIAFTPFGIINDPHANLESNFLLRLKQGRDERRYFYPKSKYQQNICPVCTGVLIKYKHGKVGKGSLTHPEIPSHDLDRKCTSCKCKFLYQIPYHEYNHGLNPDEREYFVIVISDKIPVPVKKQTDMDELENRYKEVRNFYAKTNPEIAKMFDKVLQDKP
ncbi:MAG: hypothetical protein KGI28_02375 [Thaumarchaeota archaeon]|nr:hypothetical protein [Nitrososphaerota archaeon]